MTAPFSINKARRTVEHGGVIVYPTEGVFGLGCLPDDAWAVRRVLSIKQRDVSQGLILIGARREHLQPWIDSDADLASSAEHPRTWIVPASPALPRWISGRHLGVAVRLVSHPTAAAICDAVGGAIVSTSANVSGRPPAKNTYVARQRFRDLVDYVVPGRCLSNVGPSEIRDLVSGKTLRKATRSNE